MICIKQFNTALATYRRKVAKVMSSLLMNVPHQNIVNLERSQNSHHYIKQLIYLSTRPYLAIGQGGSCSP